MPRRSYGGLVWLGLAVSAIALSAAAPAAVANGHLRTLAALRGLERRYGAGREHRPVYIEAGPDVPAVLTAVGRQPVEVVARPDLVARYAGRRVAPELTTVTVTEQWGLLGPRYSVTVSSTGLLVQGARAIPLGGTHIYHVRPWVAGLRDDGDEFIAH